MGRHCAKCKKWYSSHNFSGKQWTLGEGTSWCKECVKSLAENPAYDCRVCHKTFKKRKSLDVHMQVHRPRTVDCLACGEQRSKSGTDFVQHVESGFSFGCRGKETARQHIYDFAQRQSAVRPYLIGETPGFSNGKSFKNVPEFPYKCDKCPKMFQHHSQFLQHKDLTHGRNSMMSC